MKYILLLILSSQVFASEKTNKTFTQNVKAQGLTLANQSYCYTNEKEEIEGMNVDMRIRLASTSKLITSLWAIDKLGIDYVYNLKLYIKGNDLHIQGSFDPFLGNEKMMYLVSQLNTLGFNHFDKITFDKNVIIFPDAQYGGDEYPSIVPETNGFWLKKYFNTANWSQEFKDEYANLYALAKSGRFLKNVQFDVNKVEFVDKNPFEYDLEAKTLTLKSPPLYKYLKEMNVKSNNYVAETLFQQNGGKKEFEKYLLEKFKLDDSEIYFYTGSGLPATINNERKDNYATCSIMLNLISELKSLAESQKKEIQDVVAVPGNDKGTFKNRIYPEEYKNAFVAKTGTLMHTSTLAGAMNTQKGFNFFGIFNQSTDIAGSKVVQNEMVKSIMEELGGPKTFGYVVNGFHTYNGDTLKGISKDEFTTIDGSLE